MAVVHALLSLPHLASANGFQLPALTNWRSRSVPARPLCSMSSRHGTDELVPKFSRTSCFLHRRSCARSTDIFPQSRCKYRLNIECSSANDSSTSSTENAEGKGAESGQWGLDTSTVPTSFRQGFSVQLVAAIATGVLLWGGSNALAADPLKTCACLLKECRVELAKCIADPKCAANVACLQTCNGRADETECQIGCGDLFENKVVDEFNECAVTRKGCVPQKADEGRFPVPKSAALVPEFKTTDFTGTWYITSGLNKTFDTFDCQKHEFTAEPSKLSGNLTWRILTPDGGFFTRSTVQNFVQDDKQPGILYNHGNEFLHYQDDWYILSSRIENTPDDYVFIYYRGKNDAWDGYGGAVVYTKSKTLPSSIIPELTAAAKKVNLDFKKFTTTDNTCGPEPPLFARLEKKAEEGEKFVLEEVKELEQDVEKVGKNLNKFEMSLLGRLGKGAQELKRDEERFLEELGDEEKQLLSDLEMGAADVGKLFGNPIPLRKLR